MKFFLEPNMVPPHGGWLFIHAESGRRIETSSYPNLVIKVREFLKGNNYPVPQGLEQIIAEQVCERAPEACGTTEPPTWADRARSFANSAKKWAKRGGVVSHETYEHRIQVCQACELFGGVLPGGYLGCGKCGCTTLKLWLPTEKCPLNPPRWGTSP